MRKFKFRGWHRGYPNEDAELKASKCNGPGVEPHMEYWDWLPADASDTYKVMQYTGWKDANGKDIYEGDIVDFNPAPYLVDGNNITGDRGIIDWVGGGEYWVNLFSQMKYAKEYNGDKECWSGDEFLVLRGYSWNEDDNEIKASNCFIKGNIYENPELVEMYYDIELKNFEE